jgi:hypothetical protein
MTYCVGCHKPIPPTDAFCPLCGWDNRDPHNPPEIAPHFHDFRQGQFCPICGGSYNLEGRRNPRHGYVFRNYGVAGGVFFFALVLLMWSWPVTAYSRSYNHGRAFIPWPVGIGLAALALVVALLIRSRVLIDLDTREVRLVTGLWPFIHVDRHPLSEIRGLQLALHVVYSRYGSRTLYRVNMLLGAESVLLHEYRSSEDAYWKAQQMAKTLNVQVQDVTGMQGSSWF